ncbi:MAG: hypothetical protein ACI81R_001381 [Bradymonadia bacterium]|jgi:hypothetical protein
MQQIAAFLILIGAGSFVLSFFNYEFALLGWIDKWGPIPFSSASGMRYTVAFIADPDGYRIALLQRAADAPS